MYDDKYLYVGIRAFDSEPDKIVKQLSRRDGFVGDRVNFVIDSYNNGTYLVDEDINGTTDYSIRNPDFSFVQFRSNLMVRWEYIPGSEIFLVWSQGVTELVDSSERLFTGLENGILNQKPENIFLIKATYRFVL